MTERHKNYKKFLVDHQKERQEEVKALRERIQAQGLEEGHMLSVVYHNNLKLAVLNEIASCYVYEIIGEWRAMKKREPSCFPRLKAPKNHKADEAMRTLCEWQKDVASNIRRRYRKNEVSSRLFDDISNLYLEVLADNFRTLSYEMRKMFQRRDLDHSELLCKLEFLRIVASIGIGIYWNGENFSEAIYGDGRVIRYDKEFSMRKMQFAVVDLEDLLDVKAMKATSKIEDAHRTFVHDASTSNVFMNLCWIAGKDVDPDELPVWFIDKNLETEITEQFKYKSREEVTQ